MKAVRVDKWMPYTQLRVFSNVPIPNLDVEVNRSAVLLKVMASGVNFYDTLMVEGKYQFRPDRPFIPGTEFAGVVEAVGKDVSKVKVGDKVMGYSSTGAYAQYMMVEENVCELIPRSMSFIEAAAFSMIYSTSYGGLVYRANLLAGEVLLVHAAAGGVGSAAVQIGKALGATVIGTCGSNEKAKVVKRMGADFVINYSTEDFVDRVKEITNGKGADVVYDPVGGDVFDKSTKCIAWNGRIIVVGFTSGRIPSIKVNRILLKQISVVGLHWGQHYVFEPSKVDDCYAKLNQLYVEGKVKPLIHSTYPLEGIVEALECVASRRSYGKLVMLPHATSAKL